MNYLNLVISIINLCYFIIWFKNNNKDDEKDKSLKEEFNKKSSKKKAEILKLESKIDDLEWRKMRRENLIEEKDKEIKRLEFLIEDFKTDIEIIDIRKKPNKMKKWSCLYV